MESVLNSILCFKIVIKFSPRFSNYRHVCNEKAINAYTKQNIRNTLILKTLCPSESGNSCDKAAK